MNNEFSFQEFLLNQAPSFDALILKDIRPTDSWTSTRPRYEPIRIDARLLPNKFRRIWISMEYEHGTIRRLSKRLRLSQKTVRNRWMCASDCIYDRLKVWLKRLPNKQLRRERAKRRREPFIKRALFESAYPNLKADWNSIQRHRKKNCKDFRWSILTNARHSHK